MLMRKGVRRGQDLQEFEKIICKHFGIDAAKLASLADAIDKDKLEATISAWRQQKEHLQGLLEGRLENSKKTIEDWGKQIIAAEAQIELHKEWLQKASRPEEDRQLPHFSCFHAH